MADRTVDYLLIGGGLASRQLRALAARGRCRGEKCCSWDASPTRRTTVRTVRRAICGARRAREEAFFRPNEWWDEQGIELLTRTSVTALDVQSRTAKLSNRQEIEFGKALIATGANVRRLNVAGSELEEIHYLRTLGNADAIREGVADAEDVVLIGGSYIGCEVAASLTLMGKRCTIVMQEQITLERGFGLRAGRFFQELLESHGVVVRGGDELERFEGDGRVARVITKGGLELRGRLGGHRRGRDA